MALHYKILSENREKKRNPLNPEVNFLGVSHFSNKIEFFRQKMHYRSKRLEKNKNLGDSAHAKKRNFEKSLIIARDMTISKWDFLFEHPVLDCSILTLKIATNG